MVDLDSFKKYIRSVMRYMATDEMIVSGLAEFRFKRLMQEWGISTLTKLEDIWRQDTGHTLAGDTARELVQLEMQTRDWNEKMARTSRASRFIDISFPSGTTTEEDVAHLAREQQIDEPLFRL